MKIVNENEIISPDKCIECPFFSIQNRRNGRGVCGVYAVPMWQGSCCKKGIVVKYDECFFNCNDCVHDDWYTGPCRYYNQMVSFKSDAKNNCVGFEMRSEEIRKAYNPPSDEEQIAYYEKHPDEKAEYDRIQRENYEYKQKPESDFSVEFVFGDYIKTDKIGMYVVFPQIFSQQLKRSIISAKILIIGRVYDFSYNKRNVNFSGRIEFNENNYIIRIDESKLVNTEIQTDKPITMSVRPIIDNN